MISACCKTISALLLIFFLSSACKNKSFQGGSAKDTAKNASPSVESSSDQQKIKICDAETEIGVTSAELLTDEIPLAVGAKQIRYRIGLKDCDGQVKDLINVPILFDINSGVNPFDTAAPYRILTDGGQSEAKILASGTLATVLGTDLFGNQGSFAHWKTDNVGVSQAEKSIILEVILDDFSLIPRQDLPETSRQQLPTFLKVSTARAVQANIKFIP